MSACLWAARQLFAEVRRQSVGPDQLLCEWDCLGTAAQQQNAYCVIVVCGSAEAERRFAFQRQGSLDQLVEDAGDEDDTKEDATRFPRSQVGVTAHDSSQLSCGVSGRPASACNSPLSTPLFLSVRSAVWSAVLPYR